MRKIFLLLVIVFLLSGCATYELKTNGFFDAAKGITSISSGSSFAVILNKDTENIIFDKEIKRKIEKLLVKNGYLVKTESEAQYYLIFNYCIDDGKTTTGSFPVYNPGQTTYSQGNIYGSKGGYATYSTTSQSSGYTTYIPISRTYFTRRLQIKVIESNKYKTSYDKEPIWIGDTFSSGKNSDLRQVIDYLLIANFKYFGKNTGKAMADEIIEDNKEVLGLRKTY